MSDAEPKKSTATTEPNQVLPALARLLARQAARHFLAQKAIPEPSSPGDRDCNATRSSDSTTKPA
jgi:hypothetical protein